VSEFRDGFGAVEADRADADPVTAAAGQVEAPTAIRVPLTAWRLMDAPVIDNHITVGR